MWKGRARQVVPQALKLHGLLAVSLFQLLGRTHRLVEFPRHGTGGIGDPCICWAKGGHALRRGQFSAGGLQPARQLAELPDLALRGRQLLELSAQIGDALGGRAGCALDFAKRPRQLVLQGRDDANCNALSICYVSGW